MLTPNVISDRPDSDEIEVSLIGPGFGESVVVHVGGGDWLVVDSCRSGQAEQPAAIKYLEAIGVDLDAVVAIVASHWHDDHTRGLADVVRSCRKAQVYVSAAFGYRDAMRLIELYGGAPPKAAGGAREMKEVLQILEAQGRTLRTVGPHRNIYRRAATPQSPEANVNSLSPSDEAIKLSLQAMASLMPSAGGQRTALPWQGPNHNSIVLWVRVGEVRVLLGADLEEGPANHAWTAIVDDSLRDDRPAEIFKVPHHGSSTAHVPGVWDNMLVDRPHAVLTPFHQGSVRLPTPAGVQFICQRTDRGYITHRPSGNPPPVRRDPTTEKTIREAGIRLRQRAFPPGQVRLRRHGLLSPEGEWEVALMGESSALCT